MNLYMLEEIINQKVVNNFSKTIKKKYPNLTFTTQQNNDVLSKFPTVYIHLMPSREIGRELENDLNGVQAYFQIDVYDNKSKANAKEVSSEVAIQFKKLGFGVNTMPYVETRNGVYRGITRVSKSIANGDFF